MPSIIGIEQFGDSTTMGLTWNGTAIVPSQLTAPDQVYLDGIEKWPGRVVVYNRGVSGSIANDLLTDATPFTTRMASSTAQIVTFNYGMNESAGNRQTVQQYASSLDKLVKIAKAYGKIVVLLEPNPTTNPINPNLAMYVKAMNSVASANQTMLVPHHRIWSDCNFTASMLSDGIHPTKEGYIFKGHTEFQYMFPMISSYLAN